MAANFDEQDAESLKKNGSQTHFKWLWNDGGLDSEASSAPFTTPQSAKPSVS
jgi:hypothetical protein